MAQFYNIKAYQEGDKFQSKFGELQTYWLEIEGVNETVRTNKKVGNTPRLGNQYGELIAKTNQKGGTYYDFKSVQTPDGVTAPVSTEAEPVWFAPYKERIERLEGGVVQAIMGNDEPVEETKPKEGILSDDELEDIFG